MITKRGVVLLFDRATTRRAIRLSGEYAPVAKNRRARLGMRKRVPHLSLIHVELTPAALRRCSRSLASLTRRAAIRGRFSSVRALGGWLFWLTPRTLELNRLHRGVVELFSPARARDTKISWPMNRLQRRMHRRYGYPNVMAGFRPHITLQKLGAAARVKDRNVPHPWRATAVAIVELGARGSAQRVLKRFPLKGS